MNNTQEHQIEPTAEEPQSPQLMDISETDPTSLEKKRKIETETTLSDKELKTQKEAVEKKPPSRFQRFLHKALIILAIVAVVFLAGFLTNHFVRYQPLSDTLDQTRAELEQANQTIKDLEAANVSLTNANHSANNTIADLENKLAAIRANAQFYQVLVDVNTARIKLFQEDIEAAEAALVDTQERLAELLPIITEVDPELALSLPRRLDLIVSGLARDPETGRIDLELFTKDLLELQPLLDIDYHNNQSKSTYFFKSDSAAPLFFCYVLLPHWEFQDVVSSQTIHCTT